MGNHSEGLFCVILQKNIKLIVHEGSLVVKAQELNE